MTKNDLSEYLEAVSGKRLTYDELLGYQTS